MTYELDVTNNGPSQSPGTITITDTLPEGLTFVSAVGTGWAESHTGQVITLTRTAPLASGASAPTITVIAAVDSGIGTQNLVNIASVTGPAPDPDPDDNTSQRPTPVTEDTEITLAKTNAGSDPVRAGEVATFEILVSNSGSSDARGITVTDTLPAGLTLIEISGQGWSCDSAGVCTRDRIVAGAAAPVLTVKARVASSVPDGTTLTNAAAVTTITPGDDPGDNDDDAPVDVVAEADLELQKVHSGDPVVAGTPTGYQLQVSNNGPSDAVGPLTVTDTLPAGMSYLSVGAPWACTAQPGNVVGCTVAQGLGAGQDAPPLEMQVMVATDADPGPATNTARADSPTTDPVPGNNPDDETVQVTRATNLRVTKTHPGGAHIGDDLAFTIEVTNDGPSTARDVVVTDTLPAGLEFVSASGTDWTCTNAGNEVTCLLATRLASGATAPPITLVTGVRPAAHPGVDNVVVVESSTPETDPTDNRDVVPVEVPALVDLSVTKELLDELVVGREARYRLTVTNDGPTDDPAQITLTDELPEGLSYVSAEGAGWTCDESSGTLTCVSPDGLAAGESSSVEVVVMVEPSAWPSVLNVARVTTPSEDRDPDNDADEEPGDVTPSVDLSLEKSVVSRKGDRVRYQLMVRNDGPSSTVGPIVVTDRLPKGLEFVAASGSGWSCVTAGRLVTCTHVDPLAADDEAGFLLDARIVAEPGSQVRNVAHLDGSGGQVSGSTTDDDDAVFTLASQADAPDDDASGGSGGLPDTGGPALWIAVAGLVLLGAGLRLVTRRRD